MTMNSVNFMSVEKSEAMSRINVALQCLSHTPVMNKVPLPPEVGEKLYAALQDARAQTEAFAPDLIVLFAPDHFNGVLHDMMPAFCIGAMAQGLGDYGTAAGPLRVPTELALECAQAVLEADVDVAVSHRLRVDHGFTQTLELLTGGIDRVPVLPVFVNCIAKPMAPTRRARALGEAVGHFLANNYADKRVLIVGSGGISHDPPVPSLTTAPPLTRARLIEGLQRTAEEQSVHEDRVVAAARAFSQAEGCVGGGGQLLALNPVWDRQVLGWLCESNFDALDALTDAEISEQGGSGGHEIRTWIAAFACLRAFGPSEAQLDYYQAIPDWIAGFAVAHGHLKSVLTQFKEKT